MYVCICVPLWSFKQNTRNAILQHVTQPFSSFLLCSCVPISSTVQVGALGVVSMDTKQFI